MTIISNHRVHSYKATASLHRDLSPKKVSMRKMSTDKKYNTKKSADIFTTDLTEDTTKILPTLLTALANYASAFRYKVLTPFEYLYEDDINTVDDTVLDEDDMEKAWAQFDYLECLYD